MKRFASPRWNGLVRHDGVLVPSLAVVGAIVSLSVGTSLAKHLFPILGAEGTTAFRAAISALMLLVVWKPWRRPLTGRAALAVVVYGTVLGVMNLMFYMALRTIPFGLAVAIEFAGPLAVATLSSRRPVDFLWIGFAVLGLSQLMPIGRHQGALDPLGLALAMGAGVCWALYILCGQWAGRLRGADAVAVGTAVAALVVMPTGVARAGSALLDPALLPWGLGVGLLSSALPYSLEMFALRRLPRQTFGVLLSVEPAIAALAGLLILGETLTRLEWMAIGSIVVASVGSAASIDRRPTG